MNVDLKSAAETSLKYLTISSCVLVTQFAATKVPPVKKGGFVDWMKSGAAVVVGVVGSGLLISFVNNQKVLKMSSANKNKKLIESNL